MAGDDALREQAALRLRQRLWGAAVLIALAVIGLPLLLDGSGSESQFRRVERLREEPPRIVDAADTPGDAAPLVVLVPDPLSGPDAAEDRPPARSSPAPTASVAPSPLSVESPSPAPIGIEPSPSRTGNGSERTLPDVGGARPTLSAFPERPRAWVVQAGSFEDQENAVAVRDRLRRAGYASFVSDASATADGAGSLFRVHVGPMVDEALIESVREEIVALLGRGAIVVAYP